MKKGVIYNVDGYKECIISSKRTNKFEIREMHACFYNLKEDVNALRLINRKVDDEKRAIELRDKVRKIRVTCFGEYEYKHSFTDEEQCKRVDLLRVSKKDRIKELPEFQYRPVINRPVKYKKYKNIMELLKYIPKPFQPFYLNIVSKGVDSDSDTSDDDL